VRRIVEQLQGERDPGVAEHGVSQLVGSFMRVTAASHHGIEQRDCGAAVLGVLDRPHVVLAREVRMRAGRRLSLLGSCSTP
jgi:hypothetical protein